MDHTCNIKFQWGIDLGNGVSLMHPFVDKITIDESDEINTSVFEEAEVVG